MFKVCKTIIILLIIVLILPNFSFAQAPDEQTPDQLLRTPDTFEEAEAFIIKILEPLPRAVGSAWEKAKELWQKTWVVWWSSYIKPTLEDKIFPWFQNIWSRIKQIFSKEIEKRKPIIEQELGKEKQEIKEEVKGGTAKIKKGVWERFKDLIKESL